MKATHRTAALVLAPVLSFATTLLAQTPAPVPGPRPPAYTGVELRTAVVEVPLVEAGLAIVEVRINGQGPFRFGIDTGASGGGRIDRALATKLGLQVVGQARAGDGTGKGFRTMDIVEIGTLSLGEATFSGVQAAAGEYVNRNPGGEEKLDGILGMALFEEHLLTLDFPRQRLRIEKGELPPVDGRQILGYTSLRGIPVVRLKIGETEIDAHVDAGNTRSEIVLPGSWIGKLPLAADPVVVGKARTNFNEFEVRQAPLVGSILLGGCELRKPTVDFVDIFPAANLGYKLLRRFSVTVDQKNLRIRLVPSAAAGAAPVCGTPAPQ